MIIDGLVLATIFLSALIAFFRGFVKEVLTLCGLAGALIVAFIASPFLQPMAHDMFNADPEGKFFGMIPHIIAIDVGTFALIFLATLIILNLVAHAISHGLHAVGLGAVDRTLGILFGIARGVFLVSLFYLPFYFKATNDQKNDWFKSSATLPLVDTMISTIEPYFPKGEEIKKDMMQDKEEDSAQDNEEDSKKEGGESRGFDRLDDLMRTALQPGQEPDVKAVPNEEKGYTQDQNDAIGGMIQKEQSE